MARPSPKPKDDKLQRMTDTVWSMERIVDEQDLPMSERVNLLRTHYEVQRVKEEELEIPTRDRSFLYLQEKPTAAILLVPGGHSTPAQYFDLGKHLYHSGMTVYSSLLPNETAIGDQQGGVPWQLSLTELEMRYDLIAKLGVPIHVVGSSFGSILAILLAAKQPVCSLTLLSCPLKLSLSFGERMALTWNRLFPRLFERMIAGSPHRWMADRYGAARKARHLLGSIKTPVLAMHAKDNKEVSADGLKAVSRVRRDLGAETLLLDEGGHLLLEGGAAQETRRRVLAFIQEHQKGAVNQG
jgi:alpha-beta hydrolase superfamily lysophospholipase